MKNYIKGNWKEKVFDNGWSVIKLWLYLPDLLRLPMTSSGYINIEIGKRKKVDQYGNTHFIYEDEYDPNGVKKINGDFVKIADKFEWKEDKYNVDEDLPFR